VTVRQESLVGSQKATNHDRGRKSQKLLGEVLVAAAGPVGGVVVGGSDRDGEERHDSLDGWKQKWEAHLFAVDVCTHDARSSGCWKTLRDGEKLEVTKAVVSHWERGFICWIFLFAVRSDF
jgi:hypothetical protein